MQTVMNLVSLGGCPRLIGVFAGHATLLVFLLCSSYPVILNLTQPCFMSHFVLYNDAISSTIVSIEMSLPYMQ